MEKNIATLERWASLIGGGALLAYAWRREPRMSPLSGALALGSAELLFRGITGRCPLYGALGVNTARSEAEGSQPHSGAQAFRGKWPLPEGARLVEPGKEGDDLVEEASRQSFPASDPPSFTPTRVG